MYLCSTLITRVLAPPAKEEVWHIFMFQRISKLHVMNSVMLMGMVFVFLSIPDLFVYLHMLIY